MFDAFKKKVKEERKVKTFYGYYINRNISPLITKLLLPLPITANQISLIMILCGLAAAVLFGFGIRSYAIIGSCLLILQHTLDAVDGEIARYKNQCSLRGVYLDHLTHYITEPATFLGIMFGILRTKPMLAVVIVGISAAFFLPLINLTFFIKKDVIMQHLAREGKWKVVKKSTHSYSNILLRIYRSVFAPIFRWPEYHFVILIVSIINRLDILLFFYGITLPIIFLVRVFVEFYAIPQNKDDVEVTW